MHYSTLIQKGPVTSLANERNASHRKEQDIMLISQMGDTISKDIFHESHLRDFYGFLPKPKQSLAISELDYAIESLDGSKEL